MTLLLLLSNKWNSVWFSKYYLFWHQHCAEQSAWAALSALNLSLGLLMRDVACIGPTIWNGLEWLSRQSPRNRWLQGEQLSSCTNCQHPVPTCPQPKRARLTRENIWGQFSSPNIHTIHYNWSKLTMVSSISWPNVCLVHSQNGNQNPTSVGEAHKQPLPRAQKNHLHSPHS